MGYKKATQVLPEELLLLIQNYIDGEYIYIPRKENNKRAWGARNEARQITQVRNSEIYKKYQEGISARELAEIYCLSIKSIQGIILKIKRETA